MVGVDFLYLMGVCIKVVYTLIDQRCALIRRFFRINRETTLPLHLPPTQPTKTPTHTHRARAHLGIKPPSSFSSSFTPKPLLSLLELRARVTRQDWAGVVEQLLPPIAGFDGELLYVV